MKNTLRTSLAFALTLGAILCALPVKAAPVDPPMNVFSASTTNGSTTLSTAIITARSGNGGAPRVCFVSAGSEKVASKLQAYRVTAQAIASATNSTTTINVVSTNQGVNWQSGTIIVRHIGDDTYEKRTLGANSATTNIAVTVATLTAVAPGDIIYYATTTGAPSILWGATTNTINAASGCLMGQPNKPLLVEIDATSTAGTLYSISGDFVASPISPRPGL